MTDNFTALRSLLPAVVLGVIVAMPARGGAEDAATAAVRLAQALRSEDHTSELQSPIDISYAVFCLDRKSVV